MIKLPTASLMDLLPPNIRGDAKVQAMAGAIDAELQQLTKEIIDVNYWPRMDELSSAEADELAWQFHVDFYDLALPLEQRRQLVKNSYPWHKRKGTVSAVEELIQTIFGDGEVQEWYEFGGDPYTFRVVSSNNAITAEQTERFLRALDSVKRKSARLESIQITATDSMEINTGFFVQFADFLTVRQVG